MRLLVIVPAALIFCLCSGGAPAQPGASESSYKVIRTVKAGGTGGYDYVVADPDERKLYIPRSGDEKRITVFDLDTLKPAGGFPGVGAQGVALDPASHRGFATSKPVTMWDTRSLKVLGTIPVEGHPDGSLFDPFNERIYILSHVAPNVTVINGKDGSVAGTIDLGGAPEQAATDGKGHVYIDIEDKDCVAVVDAKTMAVTARYDLGGSKTPAGLALDKESGVLFVDCRNPAVSVIMNAADGKIFTTLPIGTGVDGAAFNAVTKEAFSSQGDGTLTVVKESGPGSFAIEQTLKTMPSARTMTLDSKTQHIYLIGAEFGPAPAAAPGERPRRGPMVPDSFTILEVGK